MRRLALLIGLCCAGPALADRAGADACAAGLPPPARILYDRALPGVLGGETPRDAVTSAARGRVMAGAMTRDVARESAEAAAPCLVMARGTPG